MSSLQTIKYLMACTSLIGLPTVCGSTGIYGGLEKLYIIAYKDLAPASGDAGTPVYTLSTGGLVSEIGLVDTKKYVEIGLLKSTSGVKETMTKNAQSGTNFMTQEITLVLSDITAENRVFIESVRYQPVSILVKSRTGKWFVTGLNGQLELSALEGGTGTVETDLTGYTLTFQGIDGNLLPQVDDALITDII